MPPRLLLAFAGLLAAGPAFAHAQLVRATPGVGATVAVAPAEVAITFSEAIEPTFSSIAVEDAAGARVDAGEAHAAKDDAKRLVVGLKPLAAGVYTVGWKVTATDTHKTQGRFSFTVKP